MTANPAFIRGRQSNEWLKLSHDRKVSPRGWYQESRKRWVPKIPNSFGLPAGDSCPGKTEFCESCYAAGNENQSGVHELVSHNLRLLQEAQAVDKMTTLIGEMIGRYAREAFKRELPPEDRIFRIHWDGDFFSEDYARAWVEVICAYPDIRFWAYTRSFQPSMNVVPILADVPNLELYLSTDEHNVTEALSVAADHPGVHLALCGIDYETTRQLAPERRPLICPENSGKMALMTNGRGACVECGICPEGRRDVIFATTHEQRVPVQLRLSLRGEQSASTCRYTHCNNPVPRHSGRGRPLQYCSQSCSWKMRRLTTQLKKSREQNTAAPVAEPSLHPQIFEQQPPMATPNVRPALQLVDEHYRAPVAVLPSRSTPSRKVSDRAATKQRVLEILATGSILDPDGHAVAILAQQIDRSHAYTGDLLRELYLEVERVMVNRRCRALRLTGNPESSDSQMSPVTT